MKKTDSRLLDLLRIGAWLACVAFVVEGGAILYSYFVSIGNPEAAKNLYEGLNLYGLRQYSFSRYTETVSLQLAILVSEGYAAFLVARLLSRLKLNHPFTLEIYRALEGVPKAITAIVVLSIVATWHTRWVSKKVELPFDRVVSSELMITAAVVFIFAQIFKRGVELQRETELTV